LFIRDRPDSTLEGKSLAEIAAARGTDPVETALALVAAGSAGIF
jgi:N-acyl-D-aspartate/D-glutamate deacylase